jgi:hypothetical protein
MLQKGNEERMLDTLVLYGFLIEERIIPPSLGLNQRNNNKK